MKRVVLGGAFQVIHNGHIQLLKKAKELGYLIVVVASDETVKKRKRLLKSQEERVKLVKETGIPDEVIPGGSDRIKTLLKLKPDIVVLGYDQEDWVSDVAKRLGLKIKVIRFEKFGNYSTGAGK